MEISEKQVNDLVNCFNELLNSIPPSDFFEEYLNRGKILLKEIVSRSHALSNKTRIDSYLVKSSLLLEIREWCEDVSDLVNGKVIGKMVSFASGRKNDINNNIGEMLKILSDLSIETRRISDEDAEKGQLLRIRLRELEEKMDEWGARFKQFSDNADESITAAIYSKEKEAEKKIEESLQQIELSTKILAQKQKDLDGLFSVVAAGALGDAYMKVAEREKGEADKYRRYSIIIMLGIGAFSVLLFVLMEFDLSNPTHALMRLGVAVFFTFIVAYIARQSAIHRAQQHFYMLKGIDINAITPYIADLSDQTQQEVKSQIAQKIFVPMGAQGSCDGANFGLVEIAAKLVEKAPGARDKATG